jgi:head-tail adaptor
VAVLPESVRITRSFWISARRDVQDSARVRAVRSWIRDIVKAERALLLPD